MELIATACDRHQNFTQIQTRSEMKEKRQESIFQQKHSRGRYKGIGTVASLNKTQHFWFLLTCCCSNSRLVHKTKVSALFFSLHVKGKTYVMSRELSLEPTIAVQTNKHTNPKPNLTKTRREKRSDSLIRLTDVFTSAETLSSVPHSLGSVAGPRSILDINVREDATWQGSRCALYTFSPTYQILQITNLSATVEIGSWATFCARHSFCHRHRGWIHWNVSAASHCCHAAKEL